MATETITNKAFYAAMTEGHVVSAEEAAKAAHLLEVLMNRKPSKRVYKNKHAEEYAELAKGIPTGVELVAIDFVEAGIYEDVRSAVGFLTWATNNGVVEKHPAIRKGDAATYTLAA